MRNDRAGRTLHPPRIGAALGVLAFAFAAACSDGPHEPGGSGDPCARTPTPLAVGDTARGELVPDADCLSAEGRLFDAWSVVLNEPTLLAVTMRSQGFFPNMPFYLSGGMQVSGWATATESQFTREHLFPAGSYVVRTTSFGKGDPVDAATAPTGTYALWTRRLAEPQAGCGRETSVTYGSVAEGRLSPDDCEAAGESSDGVVRRLDGYDFLMDPERPVTVAVTADFRYRVTHWDNGRVVLRVEDIPAGRTTTLNVEGFAFQTFYILAEDENGTGSYRFVFQ